VRITAQLVHAASDRHLWARSYERDLKDVLGLQSEVARAIADEIQVEVTPQERARLTRTRPVNVESHEAYIRGRYHWGRVHPDRSIEHFQRAVAIDPENALAYAGIADAQCMIFGAAMQLVRRPSSRPSPGPRPSRRWNWTRASRNRTSRWPASSSGTIGTRSVPSGSCVAPFR